MKFLLTYVFFFAENCFSEDLPLLKRNNSEKKNNFQLYIEKNGTFRENYFSFEITINDKLVLCHLPKTESNLDVICH